MASAVHSVHNDSALVAVVANLARDHFHRHANLHVLAVQAGQLGGDAGAFLELNKRDGAGGGSRKVFHNTRLKNTRAVCQFIAGITMRLINCLLPEEPFAANPECSIFQPISVNIRNPADHFGCLKLPKYPATAVQRFHLRRETIPALPK